MRDSEVHSAVVRWLASITDVTVIKTHESGPVPAEPYLAVNLLTTAEVRENPQFDAFTDEGDEVTAAPQIETEWRFSLHAYGSAPSDILRPIRAAAHLAQKNEPLMPGIMVHETSMIRNVPDWINNAWRSRAQMDFAVRGIVTDGFVVDVIETYSLGFERA